ncbi:putative lipoprotein [Hyphomonas neptunium ATCC 15444]|uniref:Putative lipoprotein n=2 Tax=Hyphomonas TaxID=85 RepID=Q0C5N7_HYPNA|nr:MULTISPECIES: hypothetical protein [Hyphomonas]ABI77800.1 putative lipoprotein [Hyphomonas neptunium ATCC 15444]KCZ95384.1 putative lipoprotein [Hyphomonas hirschiana VP5]
MAEYSRKLAHALPLAFMLSCSSAVAQYAPVDTTPQGQTATGVIANKLSGDIAGGESGSNTISSRCFADSGPGPERRAMEAEYAERLNVAGKADADAWREQHGRDYRARLVAEGKCPAGVIDQK